MSICIVCKVVGRRLLQCRAVLLTGVAPIFVFLGSVKTSGNLVAVWGQIVS